MEALGDGKFLEDKFCKQWNQQNALNEGMHQVGWVGPKSARSLTAVICTLAAIFCTLPASIRTLPAVIRTLTVSIRAFPAYPKSPGPHEPRHSAPF